MKYILILGKIGIYLGDKIWKQKVYLMPEVIKLPNLTEVKEVIFDMKGVEYVFSAGLRAFLMLQRTLTEQGGTLKLINVSDDIRNIFEYTGFDEMLEAKA